MEWWKERVVYQIYPRSFMDSDGDGIGDIRGIISRLGDLKDLGVGVIWLSPVYRSPDADNGYDISDYCSIDPKFGTMDDMDALFSEAAKRDIKIIMDLVVNHTSDEHEWFVKSRANDPEYRDYYIWSDKPNNWDTFFMEDAWTFDEVRGQYYLHLFHSKQPDLNYKNPKVIEEIKKVLRFWLDKGAAGFRCDVINVLYKKDLDDAKQRLVLTGLEKYKTTWGCHNVLKEFRAVLDEYDCFTVGETVMVDLAEAKSLCDAERRELNMIFHFDHLEVDRRIAKYIPKKFKARKLLEVLDKWQNGLEWDAVYFENHDQSRIVSHYGDTSEPEFWRRSAKMLATLEFTLSGTPFVYQGQEIGMTNFDFTSVEQLDDVESRNMDKMLKKFHIPKKLRWKWIGAASRDNARTPVQWDASANAGFTSGTPWLGVNANHKTINYAAQRNDPESVLSYYKSMIKLRAGSDVLKYGDFIPSLIDDRVLAYVKRLGEKKIGVVMNFSAERVKARIDGEIIISNTGRSKLSGTLWPYEAIVVKL
ncbi:alpha-amylase [Clostridia bacterium]|nr:alpha-amylase [Clostridia bacterium]